MDHDVFIVDGGHNQDYGVAGDKCVVVADGSTGTGLPVAPASDMGARVIAFAAADVINKGDEIPFDEIIGAVEAGVRRSINFVCKGLPCLKVSDFAATMLFGIIRPDGAMLHVQGDGATAMRCRDGHGNEQIVMRRYVWKVRGQSAPPYLYLKFVDGFASYKAGLDEDDELLMEETVRYDVATKSVTKRTTRGISLGSGVNGITITYPQGALSNLIALGVFTDGVGDMMLGDTKAEWWEPVARIMMESEGSVLKALVTETYRGFGDDVGGARIFA